MLLPLVRAEMERELLGADANRNAANVVEVYPTTEPFTVEKAPGVPLGVRLRRKEYTHAQQGIGLQRALAPETVIDVRGFHSPLLNIAATGETSVPVDSSDIDIVNPDVSFLVMDSSQQPPEMKKLTVDWKTARRIIKTGQKQLEDAGFKRQDVIDTTGDLMRGYVNRIGALPNAFASTLLNMLPTLLTS